MSGTLFGIDATTYGVWRGTTVRMPGGVERNRDEARAWAEDRRAGRDHKQTTHGLMRILAIDAALSRSVDNSQ
jgi:hypothetical protein